MRTMKSTPIVLILAALFCANGTVLGQAKPYRGAEYRTKDSYLYGRFQVRMKALDREGTLASFFTYNDDYPNTPWNEIDIEILGRYTDDVQFNAITPGQQNHLSHYFVSFDPSSDYHVYGFEWTPSYVAWFIDSTEVYRQDGAHISTLTHPQKIMMNVWPPIYTSWVGSWNEGVLPAFAFYDWVRYDAYTPGSGTTGTGGNFTPAWQDNFDSWDTTRWEKGTHTFPGNNCNFTPTNAVFQNGSMILCLTDSLHPGYADVTPPRVLWARVEGNDVRIRFSEPVEQSSAELTSNYIFTNLSILTAYLQPDQKTVILKVPGIDTSSVSRVFVLNVRDRWSIPNAMSPTSTTLIRPTNLTFPLKIDVGDTTTTVYTRDREWVSSGEYGRLDGLINTYPDASIVGTTEPEIYRSEASGICEYKIRVPNGPYDVELMMAENQFNSSGLRSTTIVVEGRVVDQALDLFASQGFRTAYDLHERADVVGGFIDVHFQGLVGDPVLDGITITPISSGVKEETQPAGVPETTKLLPNYPNPFNPSTTIRYTLAGIGRQAPGVSGVRIVIYDMLGREVARLVNARQAPGTYEVRFDGSRCSSGVYYYRLSAGNFTAVRKMILVK